VRVAKRLLRGAEQPLRKAHEIFFEIQERVHYRIRHGAPAVSNEELITLLEAIELIMVDLGMDRDDYEDTEQLRLSEAGVPGGEPGREQG
jgi:hypothetical protein